ncbi:hypothetical protein ACYOEI_08365 [Singulisphaera rosea]
MNPQGDAARSALERTLEAWKAGKRPDALARDTPPVQVGDNEWAGGRKLGSFEILGELPSEADKRFKVKLTYDGKAKDAEVVFIVLGAGASAVFREEDYARMLNMDNNPPVPSKRRR